MRTGTSKVRDAPVKAVIPSGAPPQRFVLGPSDLARLGVDLALELGRRALPDAARRRSRFAVVGRRVLDLDRPRRFGGGGSGGEVGDRGFALQALKLCLLLGG